PGLSTSPVMARSRNPCRIVVDSSLIHHAPFAAAEKCCASVCSSRGRWSGKNLCRRYPSGRLPPETLLFQARAYGRANDWGYGLKTAADRHGLPPSGSFAKRRKPSPHPALFSTFRRLFTPEASSRQDRLER